MTTLGLKFPNAIEALAEAWASIDGKLDDFRRERDQNIDLTDPTCKGHYAGYCAEAEEMIARLEKRGFVIIAKTGEAT